MTMRIDETWHRLREWTYGQAPSERLAAQILWDAGYTDLDPSHPLGGPDKTKDAVCIKDGRRCIMAVYFPRGEQSFADIKAKFMDDLTGVAKNAANVLVFVTNQELTLGEREHLHNAAGATQVELFHLERLHSILDRPHMAGIRQQFLGIAAPGLQPSVGWSAVLPEALKPMISLVLTTPPQISEHIAQSPDGQFWSVHWDSSTCLYNWYKITEEYAENALQPVVRMYNKNSWRDLLPKRI